MSEIVAFAIQVNSIFNSIKVFIIHLNFFSDNLLCYCLHFLLLLKLIKMSLEEMNLF